MRITLMWLENDGLITLYQIKYCFMLFLASLELVQIMLLFYIHIVNTDHG